MNECLECWRSCEPATARLCLPNFGKVLGPATSRLRHINHPAGQKANGSENRPTQVYAKALPIGVGGRTVADPVNAIQSAWTAIGQDEYSASAYVGLGKALLFGGDRAEFDRVTLVTRDKGLALITRGEHARAAAFFDAIAEVFPTQPEQFLAQKRYTDLVRLVAKKIPDEPDETIRFCWAAIGNDEFLPSAYAVMGEALRAKGDQAEHNRIALIVRDKGLSLIERGELARGAAFFSGVAGEYVDVCRGYALLYGQISEMASAYRAQRRSGTSRPDRRRLIIALAVWGDRYIELFTRYFIPSLLSSNNLPELSRIRDVSFDIYTSANFIAPIQASASYRELLRYAKVDL